jgi:hypothetical protein
MPTTPGASCPGSQTSEGRRSFWLIVILCGVTAFAIWRHEWALAATSVATKGIISAGYSLSRGLAKLFAGLLDVSAARILTHFFGARTMTTTGTIAGTTPPAQTAIDNAIASLAAKIDPTDTAELAALMLVAARYAVKKLEGLVNKSSLATKFGAEVQAFESIINAQV